jgi:hypothetical protein
VETFIVRVWETDQSTVPIGDRPVRGRIRHVRSGRETSFSSWEELRGIMTAPAVALSSQSVQAGPGSGEA